MTNFKKFIPFLLVAIIFAVGGYVAGNMGGSQEASIYKAATIGAGNFYVGEAHYRNGNCLRIIYNDNGSLYAQYSGRWGGDGCVIFLYPNANGTVTNQGKGIYVVTNTNRNNIVDNGNGICAVTFSDGTRTNGIPVYGAWDNTLKQYNITDSTSGIFIGCNTSAPVPVTPKTTPAGIKPTTIPIINPPKTNSL